jgi:hypothetical protein
LRVAESLWDNLDFI